MEFFQRFLNQARALWASLSAARKFAFLTLAALGVAAAVTLAYFSSNSEYRVLFSNLGPDEAGAITAKLDAQSIPYKLDQGGATILVPSDRLAKTRVDLGRDGIPLKGGKGLELFDEAPLGMTPFVQNVNFLRALQTELARSIMEIEPVVSARVIIARGEQSPFVRDQKMTTASVVLKLKPNSVLNRSTAAGIIALVARSVEGLKPENVTVLDSNGRQLTDPRSQELDGLPNTHIEYRRELESYLASKAEDMLARSLGPGRAIVRVSADINFQRLKEKSETVSPENKAIIAERTSTSSNSGGGSARGPVGAVSNISRPGRAAAAAAAADRRKRRTRPTTSSRRRPGT